jgi:hypothetical protein
MDTRPYPLLKAPAAERLATARESGRVQHHVIANAASEKIRNRLVLLLIVVLLGGGEPRVLGRGHHL